MSLDLDTRQRAMLHEMGVHVWLPLATDSTLALAHDTTENIAVDQNNTRAKDKNSIQTQAAAPPLQVPAPQPSARPAARPATAPTVVKAMPTGVADMDWPTLASAVTQCQGCAMCLGRRAPVLAAPAAVTPCDWLVLGDPPDEQEERAGQPFVDAPGKLLDNMLRAVGVQRWQPDPQSAADAAASAQRAYLSHVLKCRPALARAPSVAELVTCSQYVRREITLTQPKVILAMGRFAMQLLLSETPPELAKQPLGKLRGQVWRFAGVPVVVTYPPAYLLRSGQDKGKAWADLCLALDVAQGSLPASSD